MDKYSTSYLRCIDRRYDRRHHLILLNKPNLFAFRVQMKRRFLLIVLHAALYRLLTRTAVPFSRRLYSLCTLIWRPLNAIANVAFHIPVHQGSVKLLYWGIVTMIKYIFISRKGKCADRQPLDGTKSFPHPVHYIYTCSTAFYVLQYLIFYISISRVLWSDWEFIGRLVLSRTEQ